MWVKRMKRRNRGFTLVELLVVIGVIAVLIGILVPVLGKARISSKRTACQAQLRDIGNLFQMYLNENKQRVPRVNPTPSVPGLVPGAPSSPATSCPLTKSGMPRQPPNAVPDVHCLS